MTPQDLDQVLIQAAEGFGKVSTRPEWEAFKATVLGPKGTLTAATKGLGAVPAADKPAMGKKLNEIKKAVEAVCDEALKRVEAKEALKLLGAPIDPTLPTTQSFIGSRHPISQVIDRMVEIFSRVGFSVRQDTELETEWFCFDALNSPPDHSSRDMQDTYYMPGKFAAGNVPMRGGQAQERYLLRTHTSASQIREMLERQPPLRIIVPGRVFRRDDADATHSANFHQLEGLYIDRNVSLKDMKALLDYFVRSFFGPNAETRLRPSYFPFVEPGFEFDFRSPDLGKLSGKWIELWGCGMVHPQVLQNVGIDSDKYSGYAFGMGVERLAMILYGLDDIRACYQNDLRLLQQLA